MSDIRIIPYIEVDGSWTFPDSFIAGMFDRLRNEGLLRWVFPVRGVTDRDGFVSYLKGTRAAVLAFAGNEVQAAIWLDRFEGRSACVNYFTFKTAVLNRRTKTIGLMALKHFLGLRLDDGSYVFDCLRGVAPVNNPLGRRFLRTLGMKEVGIVENRVFNAYAGKSVDAIESYMTREILSQRLAQEGL